MFQLTVNGESRQLPGPCDLQTALGQLGYEGGHFAVALDGQFVPRHQYPSRTLQGGEQLEVLSPMQGG